MSEQPDFTEIDALWEYADPAASEVIFQTALSDAQGDTRLELLTQIARTYGLRQQFAAAHRLLDEVEQQIPDAGPRPSIRYLLERGRTFNSDGRVKMARPFFVDAWELALEMRQEGLAVDAAHMIAITFSGEPEAIKWNRRGLAIARKSEAAKAQALIPALLNNTAWDLHEMGRFAEALPLFEEALAAWTAKGKIGQIRIAKWSVARCFRSLYRYQDALFILEALEADHAASGSVDGYVLEEIAENLTALGQDAAARPYFGRAFAELIRDPWLKENEPSRLARLKMLAGQ